MEITIIVTVIIFGFLMILADILFIPGGIAGSIGGIFIITAIVIAHKYLGKETAYIITGSTIIFAVLLVFFSIKFKLWNVFVAKDYQDKKEGFVSYQTGYSSLKGKKGKVLTSLHPSGTVIIDGKKIDAVSEGGYIEEGNEIEVIKDHSGQVKVKQI